MINIKKNDILIYLLIIISISSFFIGFYFNENSAGAGTLNGDFKNVWVNLNTFTNYSLDESLGFVKSGDRNYYISSRTPILYILNAKLNPFVSSINSFIKSIFIFSFSGFILFYYLLRSKFYHIEKKLIILISSCLLLSPYFRTSSYWGLEENYGLISAILSFYFYNNLVNKDNLNNYLFINLFLVSFFSSLCVYFDQKLVIVPLLILFKLLKLDLNYNLKKYLIIFFFIFSFPYIFFILQWNNIVPPGDAIGRSVGSSFIYYHPIYASTMIAFYLFPLMFFKENLLINLKNLIINKFNIILIFLYLIYLIFLFNFHDLASEPFIGKGLVHKFSNKFIESIIFKKIFIYLISFFSFVLILLFVEKKLIKTLFIFFLYLMSIFTYPLQQEYFDPIIIIMFFGFIEKNLIINKSNCIFLFLYLTLFLIIANIYYNSIL